MDIELHGGRLLLSFYGDDFTGATDSMEALTINGLKTVLFLEPPEPMQLADRFPDIRAFGVAGVGRSMGPDRMKRELRPILACLRSIPTPIVHYKICSTFDSSPAVGSIGYAMELAAEIFPEQRCIPLLVGAPALQRYTLFGHHFAASGGDVYRLDRHPVMSRHPVTPMEESDLRVHLSKQTKKSVGLLNIVELDGDYEEMKRRYADKVAGRPDAILFDVLDDVRLQRAGRLIWEEALEGNVRFVVGSSGVEYALVAHWRQRGIAAAATSTITASADLAGTGPVEQLLVVSGSCSSVTETQIRYALARGFVGIRVDAERLIEPDEAEQTVNELRQRTSRVLTEGGSPLLYTAMGADDRSIRTIQQKLTAAGNDAFDTGRLLGESLGRLTRLIVKDNKLKRFVAAGGDTSGYVTRELGIYAIECLSPIAPGGPLCISYSTNSDFDGLELALKGGQVGQADYFVRVRDGQ